MYAALSAGNTNGVNYGGMAIAVFALFGLYGMLGVSPFALTTGILAFVFKHKSPERTGAFPVVAFVLGLISFVATILFFVVLGS
jgi:Mn2+/Fe2+ NRAMP family transporter